MNKKTAWIVAIVFLLIIIVWGISKDSQVKNKNVIKLGVVATMSGAGANLGVPWVGGMQAAVDEINAKGGVNGKKFELDVQPTAIDGAESVNTVRYLLANNNPDIFFVLFQVSAAAINPILKEAKKPLFSLSFSRSIPEKNPYAIKGNFDSLTGCEQLTQYTKDNKKYKQLGVLMSGEDYNVKCLEGIKKVEPNIKEYHYNFGQTDFRSLLAKANHDGVDVLEQVAIDFEYLAMFKQINELGYKIKMACNTASECMTGQVKDVVPAKNLEGTMGIDFTPINTAESDFGKTFLKNHPTYDVKNLTNYTAMGYDSIELISKAMESCKADDPACVVDAITKVKDYNSVIGSEGFIDRVQQFKMNIYEYNNGNWALKQ